MSFEDRQRLVELVLDTMAREATRADRVQALNRTAEGDPSTSAAVKDLETR